MPDNVSFFSNAIETYINHGHFNAVERDQINNNTVYGDLVQYSVVKEKAEWTIEDEYIQVPTGRVKLLEKISEVPIFQKWDKEYDPEAKRVIHVASISNEHPKSRFIRVSYCGRDARKASLSPQIELDSTHDCFMTRLSQRISNAFH
ncbi:hypothetical protein L218DRAFT_1079001 [Marasmius fiardii PR-910]|nr:hypothetical protein L218DRAFT_1079001 [Marasmius fiardii PR-910]